MSGFSNRYTWSANNLTYSLKNFIVNGLAADATEDKAVEEQLFKNSTPGRTGATGSVDEDAAIEQRIYKICMSYPSRNFEYSVNKDDSLVTSPPNYYHARGFGAAWNDLPTDAKACTRACSLVNEKRSAPPVQPFNFMKLPAELRNMIYGYLLQGVESTIEVQTFRKFPSRSFRQLKKDFKRPRYDCQARLHFHEYYCEFSNQEQRLQPKRIDVAILRASKTCHDEAEWVLYHSHSFNFDVCGRAAFTFFNAISPNARTYIAKVQINLFRHGSMTRELEWCKAVNYMAKAMPKVKLVSEMYIGLGTGNLTNQLMNQPFVRSLGRLEGIQKLRTDDGQELIRRIEALDAESRNRSSVRRNRFAFQWQPR
ncbi:MAG: hypothetical protein Q9188_005914 [Gyalolechia gomerana]